MEGRGGNYPEHSAETRGKTHYVTEAEHILVHMLTGPSTYYIIFTCLYITIITDLEPWAFQR